VKGWIVAILILAASAGVALAPLPFDDATRIQNSVSIRRAPELVFAYVTAPANWPKWHPLSLTLL
jgi:hypothetical protein